MDRVTTETLRRFLDDFKKAEQERNLQLLRGEYLSHGVNPYLTSHPVPTHKKFEPDYERGDVVEIDKPSREGNHIDPKTGDVEILPADPNHGREGPVWSSPKAEGEPYEVWFEDGILPYEGRDLNATGDSWDMSTIPEIRPKEGVVKDAIEKLYPNPGHVFSRSHERGHH